MEYVKTIVFMPLTKTCKFCGVEFEANDYLQEEDTCEDCKIGIAPKSKEDIAKEIELNDYIFNLAISQIFTTSLPEKDLEEFDPYIFNEGKDCPKCGYPVCKDGIKYLGEYTSGRTCSNCGYINKLKMAKTTIQDSIKNAKTDYYKKLNAVKKSKTKLGFCK